MLVVGSWLRILMEMSSKFDIERFDGKTSFTLWQVRMAAILSSLNIKDVIYGREVNAEMTDKRWKEINDKALPLSNCV